MFNRLLKQFDTRLKLLSKSLNEATSLDKQEDAYSAQKEEIPI